MKIRGPLVIIHYYFKKLCLEEYNKIKKLLNREEKVKELATRSSMLLNRERAETIHQKFAQEDVKLTFLWQNTDPLFIRSKDLKSFAKDVDDVVNKLDSGALNLVKMYKVALAGAFSGYFDDIKDVTESMLHAGLIEEHERESMEQEFCMPVVENLTKRYNLEILDLQV